MPGHKNQHYVPRCHLKPFSLEGSGKAINLLNIETEQLIRNASVRSQCSKDYFYGADLEIEKWLQNIEGNYASIVKGALATNKCNYINLQFLRDFCYLQYLRTDIAIRRSALAQHDMAKLIFENVPIEQRPDALSSREIVEQAIKSFVNSVREIGDLKVCLVQNATDVPFVTSDDPGIMINRFYAQRLGPRWKSFGIKNAGVIFVLPLSPKLLMYSYDGDVYTCPDSENHMVEVDKISDVAALNRLHYLKASQNLYFSDWAQGENIKAELKAISSMRPAKWHNVRYAVRDDEGSGADSTRYRVVETATERAAADEALIHLENVMLNPHAWCSKFIFRHKLKFVDTKSGAGYERRLMF